MVRHCIRCHCFILLPNVWVVFKIYFATLHKIVARNNVQQSIRLNKQKGKKILKNALLHYIQLVMLHIRVICFEHMATWKRCKRCVVIFLKTVKANLNVQRFSPICYTMIFVLVVYAKSFKSIGMLAYRTSFCYAVNLKFVEMLL